MMSTMTTKKRQKEEKDETEVLGVRIMEDVFEQLENLD